MQVTSLADSYIPLPPTTDLVASSYDNVDVLSTITLLDGQHDDTASSFYPRNGSNDVGILAVDATFSDRSFAKRIAAVSDVLRF